MFTNSSSCILYGTHLGIVQNMLDYDFLAGRSPSVKAVFSPQWWGRKYKVFFWGKEIMIPSIWSWDEVSQFENVDTLINLASYRTCTWINREAIVSGHFKAIFTIAEGVAERETRELIIEAAKSDTAMFGPSVVGALIAGVYRISHTAGSLENIMKSRLHQAWSVGLVSKSWGMMGELMRVCALQTDGIHSAFQVWGDRYPMTTFQEVIKYFQDTDGIEMIVLLWEVGNRDEIEIAQMVKSGEITKPIVARCIGESAEKMKTQVQFGHAGASANHDQEKASYKNTVMKESWIHVPGSYDTFGELIGTVYQSLGLWNSIARDGEVDTEILEKLRILTTRRPTRFTSTISDERWEELMYNGKLISDHVTDSSIARVIGHLWLRRELPDYGEKFLNTVMILLADHGPAVSGATNTIITARAGKDLVSSVVSWLLTIGPKFGGAIDGAAKYFFKAVCDALQPQEFVNTMKKQKILIPGIGHKVKSKFNPDVRCQIIDQIAAIFPTGATNHYQFARSVEEITLTKKANLILNVDGCIAALLLDLLVNMEFTHEEIQQYINAGLFNAFFIAARTIGFLGHALDQKRLNEWLYRTSWDDVWYQN